MPYLTRSCQLCEKPFTFHSSDLLYKKRIYCSKSCASKVNKNLPLDAGKSNLGRKRTDESKQKMSKKRMGVTPWNKGKTYITPRHNGTWVSIDCVLCGNEYSKPRWRKSLCCSKVCASKYSLRKMTKSSLEIKVEGIIRKHNLPYKFVGNGDFYIEKKCPDFININGKKTAVEVFYKGHKEEFRGGMDTWKKEREDIFKKYGWNIIFIEAKETNNEDRLVSLLMEGKSHE